MFSNPGEKVLKYYTHGTVLSQSIFIFLVFGPSSLDWRAATSKKRIVAQIKECHKSHIKCFATHVHKIRHI